MQVCHETIHQALSGRPGWSANSSHESCLADRILQ